MIEHQNDKWGGRNIFTDSKILMYDFVRGESIKGVIINQKTPDGHYRIGGPVGLESIVEKCQKVYLHNIKNVPGSKKVIDGVYW